MISKDFYKRVCPECRRDNYGGDINKNSEYWSCLKCGTKINIEFQEKSSKGGGLIAFQTKNTK